MMTEGKTMKAITILENAGKHIAQGISRDTLTSFTAVEAARSPYPNLQALAILSVSLARVTGAKDDGWVGEICSTLGIPN
jgi:hypothetical protein